MDDLAARLESLFRRHAHALERQDDDGEPIVEQFQKQFRLLIAQYGEDAVEDALARFRAGPERPSVSLH
jgi:hypothetical protein